jgi:hypothetical protein
MVAGNPVAMSPITHPASSGAPMHAVARAACAQRPVTARDPNSAPIPGGDGGGGKGLSRD